MRTRCDPTPRSRSTTRHPRRRWRMAREPRGRHRLAQQREPGAVEPDAAGRGGRADPHGRARCTPRGWASRARSSTFASQATMARGTAPGGRARERDRTTQPARLPAHEAGRSSDSARSGRAPPGSICENQRTGGAPRLPSRMTRRTREAPESRRCRGPTAPRRARRGRAGDPRLRDGSGRGRSRRPASARFDRSCERADAWTTRDCCSRLIHDFEAPRRTGTRPLNSSDVR